MSDVVERLRDTQKLDCGTSMPLWLLRDGMLGEAADEIERLRAEVERLQETYSPSLWFCRRCQKALDGCVCRGGQR